MDDPLNKYRFSTLSLKKDVLVRFRNFSGEVATSHSKTMEAMLNFFQWNELSPNDDLGIKNQGTIKRINALIAILKNIEKQQTRPTKAMLDVLFKEVSKIEEQESEELEHELPLVSDSMNELEHYRSGYEQLQGQYRSLKENYELLIGQITFVKSKFGNGYLKLEMDKDQFDKFKEKVRDVHHH